MSKTTDYYCAECGRSGERGALTNNCPTVPKSCPMKNGLRPAPLADPASVPGYESLEDVLDRAYEQAARGKGHQRHGQGQPFEQQPMQTICDLYGPGFALGQAAKKAQESMRMEREPAVRELLGAINYLAGAVIWLEAQEQSNTGEPAVMRATA